MVRGSESDPRSVSEKSPMSVLPVSVDAPVTTSYKLDPSFPGESMVVQRSMPGRSAVVILPLAVLCIWGIGLTVLTYVERHWAFHTIAWRGDLDYLVVLIVLGTPLFGALSLLIMRLNPGKAGIGAQHAYATVVLYAGLVITITVLSLNFPSGGASGYHYLVALVLTAVYAVLVNAATVGWACRSGGRGRHN